MIKNYKLRIPPVHRAIEFTEANLPEIADLLGKRLIVRVIPSRDIKNTVPPTFKYEVDLTDNEDGYYIYPTEIHIGDFMFEKWEKGKRKWGVYKAEHFHAEFEEVV